MKCWDSFRLPRKNPTKNDKEEKKRQEIWVSSVHIYLLLLTALCPNDMATHSLLPFVLPFILYVSGRLYLRTLSRKHRNFFRGFFSVFFFSLKEPDFLGHIRVEMRENHSTDADMINHLSGGDVNGGSCSSSKDKFPPKPSQVSANSRSLKLKWRPASIGSVPSFRGKEDVKAKLCSFETAKPLKLDAKLLSISDNHPDIPLNPIMEMQKETEDFLFKMLEDGFQLDRDVIGEVLGKHFEHCYPVDFLHILFS